MLGNYHIQIQNTLFTQKVNFIIKRHKLNAKSFPTQITSKNTLTSKISNAELVI